ncbi:hypothetical protein KAH81_04590 [bacterium]|nr:hypothetical protein [bacterium]
MPTYYGFVRATNYGLDYDSLIWAYDFNDGCLGWESGEIFVMNTLLGRIYYSNDTLRTKYLVHDFGYNCPEIARGSEPGELYVYDDDSIFYSADYGTNFVVTNNSFHPPSPSFPSFITGGNDPGYLYA